MSPERLREMISTGSPGMADHALKSALTTLKLSSPRARQKSPYAIPTLVQGMPNAERLIARAMELNRP